MAHTLYFSNPDTQAVQKILNVLEQPELVTLEVYNRPHRDIFEQFYADELGSSAAAEWNQGESTTPGVNSMGWVVLNTTPSTGAGTSNATSSRIWTPKPVLVDGIPQYSDERAHAPHRQDQIKLNYWKVRFSNSAGSPYYSWLALSDYPNFASEAPGWWTDPNP